MSKITSTALIMSLVAALAACGGGGDEGSNGVPPPSTDSNPLNKYQGTYYVCEGRQKTTVTIISSGENSANISYAEDIYADDNCGGAIVGSYREPQPATATYLAPTAVTLPPITILPFSDIADRATLAIPSMTAQLTGTGVRGLCVDFTNGNVCYESLQVSAATATGAIYQNDDYLLTFVLENGTLSADAIYSKRSTFNVNELALD